MIKPDKDTATTKLNTTIPNLSQTIALNWMKEGLNHNNVNRDQTGRN